MITKSIQDAKLPNSGSMPPKATGRHGAGKNTMQYGGSNHARKASVGVISPSYQGTSSSLFENKLIFSGSQLETFNIQKITDGAGVQP